jgi:branched-subunit amino acid aminotransferase/4-amino-4-deoxychorismate lyase
LPPADLVATTHDLGRRNHELTSANPVCRVGHWVTRGTEEWRPSSEHEGSPTCCIFVQPVGSAIPAQGYEEGVALRIVSTRRSPLAVLDPRLKTTSRMHPIVAEMEGSGALALMLDLDDHVAEGPTFNFFMVRGGELLTPRAERVLPGITRAVILSTATDLSIPVTEADLSVDYLATADEWFVTASTWGVVPVRSVDRSRPRDRVPGEMTSNLTDRLAELTGFHPLEEGGR